MVNNITLNNNQLALSGVTPVQTNNTFYLQPLEATQPNLGLDNYEQTRDKNFFDFGKGVIVGIGKGIYDMGSGLVSLGKGAAWVVTHPVKTVAGIGKTVVYGVSHPIQSAKFVATLPFKIAEGIVKPYSESIKQGKYGEFVGRLGLDIGIILMSAGIASEAKAGTKTAEATASVADDVIKVADKTDDVVKVATETTKVVDATSDAAKVVQTVAEGANAATSGAGSQIAQNAVKVGDVLIGDINVAEGGKVFIKIGNGVTKATTQGAATIKTVETAAQTANTVSKVAETAGTVAKTAETANTISKVAETASAVASVTDDVAKGATAATAAATALTFEDKVGKIGAWIGRGIDGVAAVPKAIVDVTGKVIIGTGNAIGAVGNVVLHPIQSAKWLMNPASWVTIHQGAITGATSIGNGLRVGADLTAKGLLFAAQHPLKAAVVAGAVGRVGKAGEDVLTGLDVIR